MSLKNFTKILEYKLIVLVILLIPLANYQVAIRNSGSKKEFKYKIFKNVIDSLIKMGVDSIFVISLINDNRTHFDERFAKINVISQPKLDFTKNFDDKAIWKIHKFIEKNYDVLQSVETRFNVPKEIVAIILWVESKFGDVVGKNHIPSVLLSMAAVANPEILENLLSLNSVNAEKEDSLYQIFYQRAKIKENFALNELYALFEIQKKGLMEIQNLYGSFSGAFGIPQFVPSSYLKYGYDGNLDGKVDLFNLVDAIYSVANFLHQNGWISGDTKSYYRTLYKYNKSQLYVESILYAYNKLKNYK
ncbi:MAG: lytic murein transglycosylase [Candidatus Kapaibacteriota bacterium]